MMPEHCDALMDMAQQEIAAMGHECPFLPVPVAELPAPTSAGEMYVALEPFTDVSIIAHRECGAPIPSIVYRPGQAWEHFDPYDAAWKELPHHRDHVTSQEDRDGWIAYMVQQAMHR